jgi:hypothetical protein
MDNTFTPIVAQSSVGPSLMITLTVPFWGWGLELLELEFADEHPTE